MAENSFLLRLNAVFRLFGNFSVTLLVSILFLHAAEIAYISVAKTIPDDILNVIAYGLLYSTLLYAKLLLITFLPFILIVMLGKSEDLGRIFLSLTISLILLCYLLLIFYFQVAMVPLGSELFSYSGPEIVETIKTSQSMGLNSLTMFLIVLFIVYLAIKLVVYKPTIRGRLVKFLFVIALGLSFFGFGILPKSKWFDSDFSQNLASNKLAYFLSGSWTYFTDKYSANTLADAGKNETMESNFNYVNPENYPFLRTEETPDVLGDFFQINESLKPNIVLISVEGLGRAFSGPNAYLGSFTPYLDSLAEKSLYWENFIASQGRTFASLPSILGSLPFAETGFNDLDMEKIPHLSLFSILKKSGYHTGFIAGADLAFDHQQQFLEQQNTSEIIGASNFGPNYKQSSATASGDSWGYPDREIFRKASDTAKPDTGRPFIRFIQTLSMHTPYSIPEQQGFEDLVLSRLKTFGFTEEKIARRMQYKNIFATVLYTDQAIKEYMQAYRKLPGYENTIFIITGDHRLPEIPISTKIDRFHVPLIIYSPMLKKSTKISSISSHLDLAPSLLAFLHKNYKCNRPAQITWTGAGLDTTVHFGNRHQYPLKQVKSNLRNYISDLFFIDGDQLFAINPNLDLEPIDNPEKRTELQQALEQYKNRNRQFIRSKKLIPKSLKQEFN